MYRFILLTVVFALALQSGLSFAQPMDAKLNMAKRSLAEIETKLSTLQKGEVSQYNKLSKQLTKVANMLKSSDSKTHPDYAISAQKWKSLRATMVTTAQQWQEQKTHGNTAQVTNSHQNSTPTKTQKKTQTAVNNINPDKILAKYQQKNRPKLASTPSLSDVEQWALTMRALQTTELQKDLVLLKQPGVPAADANRVSRWIGGNFQQQIKQDITSTLQAYDSQTMMASQLAEQIQAIAADDKMRAYNFSYGANGQRNAQTLKNGITAVANAQTLEAVFPSVTDPKRQQQLARITAAQQRLLQMTDASQATATELAALPKKQKAKKEVHLKGIAQELWYRGRVLASLDSKGSIWMNSRNVGDVESNGTIWVRGNDLGSVEPDGKVWFRGRHIGTLEDNGKVWRNGSQIGLIETNGKVWIDGNSNGEIVPFEGEWKRAAVVYYFRDIFNEQ